MSDPTAKGPPIVAGAVQRRPDGTLLPGFALNPGGATRGRGVPNAVRALIGQNGEKALQVLAEIMNGEHRAKARDRADAAKTLLERGFGKALEIQAIANLTGDDAATAEIKALAGEALMKLATALNGKQLPPSSATIESSGTSVVATIDIPPKDESPR